ncbi:unnamed protein product [Sphenostylis stenocarpa]|uniref:RING-type domain-containing protein n=1 Tax=Sphenostylis stenocarpa TaxID=92480 RepID=A0AA86SRL5_9FABA|nr:unnamed protein product [Sphenostylis stenocarpa]
MIDFSTILMGWVESTLSLLLMVIFVIFVALITMHLGTIGVFILWGGVLLFWHVLNVERGNSEDDIEAHATGNPILVARERNQRQPSSQNVDLPSLNPKIHIAMLSIRHLPPVLCFQEDETTQSQNVCSVCMEEFKNGELIQPFPVCQHQFHFYCINSWLLDGNTTCPLCRGDLSIVTETER